jgi:hypothetical protein
MFRGGLFREGGHKKGLSSKVESNDVTAVYLLYCQPCCWMKNDVNG